MSNDLGFTVIFFDCKLWIKYIKLLKDHRQLFDRFHNLYTLQRELNDAYGRFKKANGVILFISGDKMNNHEKILYEYLKENIVYCQRFVRYFPFIICTSCDSLDIDVLVKIIDVNSDSHLKLGTTYLMTNVSETSIPAFVNKISTLHEKYIPSISTLLKHAIHDEEFDYCLNLFSDFCYSRDHQLLLDNALDHIIKTNLINNTEFDQEYHAYVSDIFCKIWHLKPIKLKIDETVLKSFMIDDHWFDPYIKRDKNQIHRDTYYNNLFMYYLNNLIERSHSVRNNRILTLLIPFFVLSYPHIINFTRIMRKSKVNEVIKYIITLFRESKYVIKNEKSLKLIVEETYPGFFAEYNKDHSCNCLKTIITNLLKDEITIDDDYDEIN